jgi:archaellum component FlaG (FlaF/FlaG flagellin family)
VDHSKEDVMRRVLQVAALAFAVAVLGILSCSAQQSARRADESQAGSHQVRVAPVVYGQPDQPPLTESTYVLPVKNEVMLPASKAGPVFLERRAPQPPAQQAQAR